MPHLIIITKGNIGMFFNMKFFSSVIKHIQRGFCNFVAVLPESLYETCNVDDTL